MEHKCNYCSRCYKKKENYKKHLIACELFHKKHLMDKDDFQDSVEDLPSYRELYNLVKILAMKCNTMEEEIKLLKSHANYKQRKNITEYLSQKYKNVEISFYDWIKKITVNMKNLEKVIQLNLIEGMKDVLIDHIEKGKVPMASFLQKTNIIYIRDQNDWKMMHTDDLDKLLDHINFHFIKIYIKWQKENEHIICQSEDKKDKDIQNMMKVNATGLSNDKRNNEIKKWLYHYLEEPLEPSIEYV